MILRIGDLTADLLEKVHSIFVEEPSGRTTAVWEANRRPVFVAPTKPTPVMQVATIMVAAINAETLAAIFTEVAAIDPQGTRRIIKNGVPAERAQGL